MPTTITLRPNNVAVAGTGWAAVGAGSMDAATADGTEAVPDDATYARNGTTFTRLLLALDNPALPGAGERVTGVHVRVRCWQDAVLTDAAALRVRLEVNNALHPELDWWPDLGSGDSEARTRVGATRTRAPGGDYWDQASLTALRVQIEPAVVAGVNVSEVWARLTYVDAPIVDVLTPTGTQGTTRPEGTVTFTHTDGAPMTSWQVKVFDEATYLAPGFDPDTSEPAYTSGVQLGEGLAHVPSDDILNGTYRWYWRAAITTLGQPHWSAWDYTAFTVELDQPSTPILTATPDSSSGFVELLLTDTNNLLSQQDADFEDAALGAGTWSGAFNNATVARSIAQADHGSASLLVTVTGAGDAAAYPLYLSRAVAGQVYTAQGRLRAATTTRYVEVVLRFYAADGITQVGGDQVGAAVSATSGAFVFAQSIVAAPAGAEYLRPLYRIVAGGAGEGFYLDSVKVAPSLSTWSRGGLVGRNLLTLDQSNMEASIVGWGARTNCAVAQSATVAAEGTQSLRLTATADGGMSAWTAAATVPVVPGDELTGLTRIRAGTAARSCACGIQFFTTTGASLGITNGAEALDATGAFTAYTHTATAPPGAATASLVALVFDAAAGEQHYVDMASLSHDPGTVWSPGGTGVITAPLIEYTDDDPATITDALATWQPLRFSDALALDETKQVLLRDYECPPDRVRRYRARITATEAGVFLSSDPAPTLQVTLPTDVWWLKVPEFPDRNVGDVAVIGPIKFTIAETLGVFQELDDPATDEPTYPVVITGGITGRAGPFRLIVRGADEWDTLEPLLTSARTLLLVGPLDAQRYVRITDRDVELTGTPDHPRRVVTGQLLEAARP